MPPTRREALKSFAAAAALPLVIQAQEAARGAAKSSAAPPKQKATAASGAQPVCLTDFEPLAKAKMSPMAWEYVNSAAADEITVKWNREAFNRIRLRPRVLIDVSKLDTRVTLFGQEMPFPILLAPTSSHRVTHPEGEIATAHGASTAHATMVLSTLSTTSVEDVAAALKTPLWFQLYVQQDRGFTRELVQRAQAAGCRALCLTVDTPVSGARNREERAHFTLPPGVDFPHLRGYKAAADRSAQTAEGVSSIFSGLLSADLTWKDVAWLQSFAKVPLLLKGVLNPDDADRAAKEGVAGIIVSNHGGRNFDTVPATIDALPLVAEKVAGRIPILMDGGVRRGTDVLKALALGATAVQIGRPYVYGLGAAGADGVARVLQILQNEFMMAMALAGRPTISSIDRSVLWPTT